MGWHTKRVGHLQQTFSDPDITMHSMTGWVEIERPEVFNEYIEKHGVQFETKIG